MIAIVLVGGKQTSVSELYPDLPLPLISVAGEPFLYWLTQWLKTQGFTHIVYSAGHFSEKITAWAHQLASLEPTLCLDVVTEIRPLGTAGAAVLCANRFPSPFTFIVNGDSILLTDVQSAIEKLKNNPHIDGIILGTSITNAGRFGALEVNQNNKLCAFKEKQPGNGLINAGAYLLRHELLANFNADKELSLEYDCFPLWLSLGKHIEVIDGTSPFIDIGTPETLKKAHDMIMEHQPIITGQKEFFNCL